MWEPRPRYSPVEGGSGGGGGGGGGERPPDGMGVRRKLEYAGTLWRRHCQRMVMMVDVIDMLMRWKKIHTRAHTYMCVCVYVYLLPVCLLIYFQSPHRLL